MRIYRLSQFSVIDGMGGMRAAGRWHTIGRRVFYAAEHPALALVEVLAHFRVSLDRMPINFRMVAIEVAAGAIISPEPDLPHNWSFERGDQPSCRRRLAGFQCRTIAACAFGDRQREKLRRQCRPPAGAFAPAGGLR